MSTITLEQFRDYINKNITSDEEQQKAVLRYFFTEFKGTEGEFVDTDVEKVLLLEQCDNLFIQSINVYVNLKKTTILLIACILDVFLTKGVAVCLGTLSGYIEKALHVIKLEDVCLFTKILYCDQYFSGATVDLLEEWFDGTCNSRACKRCPHLEKTDSCNMNREKILDGLRNLILSKTIIPDAENKYHLN